MNNLAATLIEAEAVDTIVHWIDLIGDWLTTEASRRILRHNIRERLVRLVGHSASDGALGNRGASGQKEHDDGRSGYREPSPAGSIHRSTPPRE